jgi:hypothetical protein
MKINVLPRFNRLQWMLVMGWLVLVIGVTVVLYLVGVSDIWSYVFAAVAGFVVGYLMGD